MEHIDFIPPPFFGDDTPLLALLVLGEKSDTLDKKFEERQKSIKEWTEQNRNQATNIALYCNTPSDEKQNLLEEYCNHLQGDRSQELRCFEKQLAYLKQDCILAKIQRKSFDMGTQKEVGTWFANKHTGGKTRKLRQRRRHRFSKKSGKRKRKMFRVIYT